MKLFKRLAVTALAAITLSLSTVAPASAADWKSLYRNQLAYMSAHADDYGTEYTLELFTEVTYTVYDIDKDGTKELLANVSDGSTTDSVLYIYTISGGKVVSLGSYTYSNRLYSIAGCSGNGLLVYQADPFGYEEEFKATKKGNKLYSSTVFSRNCGGNFHAPTPMTFISASDYSYVPY